MKRPLPRTPASWLKEIKLAIADAAEAVPFGLAIGEPLTLANYVVNSDPEGIDHNLGQRPLMAFVLCYVAAHLALDLLSSRVRSRLTVENDDEIYTPFDLLPICCATGIPLVYDVHHPVATQMN